MGNATGFSINSFVFLDFETSHLLSKDHPKIIELSLIAVNRNGLLNSDVHTALNCARKENFTFDLSKVSLPRIIDKLTLCVDPRKYTSPQSARITKLDKRNLDKNKKLPFDEDVICMLNLFLSRQEAPVCLVAHNGLRFDFAILRSELSQLTTGDLSAELYCVDSLSGFRAGFTTEKQGETKQREGKNKQEPTWMPSPEPDLSLERKLPDCDNSTGMAFQQSQKRGLGDLGSYPSPSFSGATVQDSTGTMPRSYSHASDNLLTPYPLLSQSKQPLKPYTDQLKEKTPKPTHRHSATDVTYKWKVASPPSSPPQLKKAHSAPCHTEGHSVKPQRLSYSLVNIFKRTFGTDPPNSHSAEGDVVSLIKVLLPRMSEFVSWADKHATPFKNCKLYYNPECQMQNTDLS